ncbi:MAG: hypothetical protein IMY70_04810 [Bacteroidetes bacterium]|nr:hypothetical protein [Bacteroidota bacterium]
MREVVILIPNIEVEQNIEIEVRINGRKKTLQYKVELIDWEGDEAPPKDKVTVIRHKIADYDKNWELVEIGAPTKNNIPLMFRKKSPLFMEKK